MAAMSGGVDSAVAAALLLEQGYAVCGVTLKLFSNEDLGLDEPGRSCCSLADVEDARSVARRLGIDFHVFNFGEAFQKEVIARFAAAYARGETPNPCIDCNRYIKFDRLLERARLLGMDAVATGHYARVEYDAQKGRWLLKKGVDAAKDQSYVLYGLTQEQLSRTLFPLGELTKPQVRALAQARGLVNAEKPDSQDICFVRGGDYTDFLEQTLHMQPPPGDFVDRAGRVLGRHRGIHHYTVGQRRGVGLSFDGPRYVLAKDAAANTVVLGEEAELYAGECLVADLNLIAAEALTGPLRVTVRTRYHQREAPATLHPVSGGLRVAFDAPQRALTPGQAAVFYDGDVVVGGGRIV